MRFSIISGPRQRADLGQSAAEAWWNYVNDAVLADELGYDAVYFGEHHFCFASGNSSPLTMAAAVAARTNRIRIGTSIICAPFHNPLRLAEDIAAVDIASNGRFDLGIGVGSQWEEFHTFGIDPKERFGRTWEVIDILEKCLHGDEEEFDHKGRFFEFPGVRWIMQPVQDRIPILWGGFGPKGVQRAAERGYHLIAPDVTGTYERVMRENGRRPEDHLIGFVNHVSIADTWEEAFQAIAEPCQWVSSTYALRKDLDGNVPPESAVLSLEDIRRGAETGEDVGFAVPGPGTVEQTIERFLPVVGGERGLITNLCLEVRPPGTRTEDAHRTLRLFAEQVMPVLKEEAVRHGR
ncbi:Flavin-dependent oxidoreductase, luciferase family (includes alkanesulfonate monooxygenase SsuD and methylene tetrahydromethanopterin reductase) [Prauserella aidingensis]|uniref:LLM class flavin-dependent oxidoreductase n=1 Tax=Prauserella aidingensis TaxID=387890 RepID=UPI0020A58FBE|nr:LLM class flavin-dependent oxidoreductase [Prauserella aidingensis]MCP2256135.1 Flavin-dependent oxidoreductase, luciferase family (includes alkanesulfonate monooxygenase SsuD and methylene tetrahydromethanopterin reductase) [Prauserella aidingensis]